MYIEVYSSLSQVIFGAYMELKIHTTYQTSRFDDPEEHNMNHFLLMEEITLFVSLVYTVYQLCLPRVFRNKKFYFCNPC